MSDQDSPESILLATQAIKEVSSEREVNAYLKTGWTLIKTFHTTNENESQQMNYVLAWRRFPGKPKKPHIIKKKRT